MSTQLRRHERRGGSLLRRAWREAELGSREIQQGHFQRSMAAVTGFAAVVSGFEAYAQHRRGAFRHWLMWTPVWLTPPTAAAAGAALVSERVARRLLPALAAVVLADGVIGFIYHIRGIRRMPGGFLLGRYNVVMGPPLFAPLLMCTVGVTGILTGFLRRERATLPPAGRLGTARRRRMRRRAAPRSLRERVAHGRFQQMMAITAAALGVLAGGEAYFEHLRGSFNQKVMWTPVLVTPPLVVAALGAVFSEKVARTVLPVASVVSFADGALGFALHLRGIKRMPGGVHNLSFNLAMGPPVFAPLLLCSVGMLGLVASMLRRAER
jgi:hypothetical protein